MPATSKHKTPTYQTNKPRRNFILVLQNPSLISPHQFPIYERPILTKIHQNRWHTCLFCNSKMHFANVSVLLFGDCVFCYNNIALHCSAERVATFHQICKTKQKLLINKQRKQMTAYLTIAAFSQQRTAVPKATEIHCFPRLICRW